MVGAEVVGGAVVGGAVVGDGRDGAVVVCTGALVAGGDVATGLAGRADVAAVVMGPWSPDATTANHTPPTPSPLVWPGLESPA